MAFPSPPSADLRPFAVQPPEYVDPLKTLAEIRQMRTQALQQQHAQMTLEQARLKMNSQQALIGAFVKGGKDPDAVFKAAVDSGQVLPEDLTALQTHMVKLHSDMAALDERRRTMLGEDINNYLGSISGVKDQADLDAANQAAQRRGLFDSGHITPFTQYTDPSHLEAYTNSLLGLKTILDRQKTQAEIAKEGALATQALAKGKQAEAAATEAGVKTENLRREGQAADRAQAVQEMRTAQLDPVAGIPIPSEWSRIRAAHPALNLPPSPTKDYYDRFIESAVPQEKIPEYKLNEYKRQAGILGNTEFDQFLAQHARSLGKTPATLAPNEFFDGMQKYAEFKQDPAMRANALAMKALAESNLRLQMSMAPTQEDIEVQGRALLNHTMSPTQFAELRGRGPNVAGKVFTWATQHDPTFSLARAENEFKAMEKTEQAFTSGKEAGLVRSNNNAIEHLGILLPAVDALENNQLPALNRIAQYFGVATGGDTKTVFDHIASRVGDEVTKAFIPGGGGQTERLGAAGGYNSAMSPAQLRSNIRADIRLMDSQQRNLEDQYKRGTYGQGQQTLFTPEALATRDRILGATGGRPAGPQAGGPPGTVPLKVKDPQGNIHTAWLTPDQARKFSQEHPDIVVK